jgi:hypothetical protein
MITLSLGSLSVSLRNPDFGDKDSLEIRRINRKTRGGDLVMYRDPIWPRYETITWKFSFLKQTDLYNLLYFLRQTIGQKITIVDFEGRTRVNCIITTPAEEVSQDGRQDYKAGFTFEVPV